MTGESDNERRFYEGDVIVVRDTEYEVDQVDMLTDSLVGRYQLTPREDDMVNATLRPVVNGKHEIIEHHTVDGEDITVIE